MKPNGEKSTSQQQTLLIVGEKLNISNDPPTEEETSTSFTENELKKVSKIFGKSGKMTKYQRCIKDEAYGLIKK